MRRKGRCCGWLSEFRSQVDATPMLLKHSSKNRATTGRRRQYGDRSIFVCSAIYATHKLFLLGSHGCCYAVHALNACNQGPLRLLRCHVVPAAHGGPGPMCTGVKLLCVPCVACVRGVPRACSACICTCMSVAFRGKVLHCRRPVS